MTDPVPTATNAQGAPAITPGGFRLRGWPAMALIAAVQIVALAMMAQIVAGGGQGPVKDSEHFLSNHGRLTRVAENTWHAIGVVSLVIPIGFAVALASFLASFFCYVSYAGYETWPDYSAICAMSILIYLAAGICADFLSPRW